MKCIHVPPPLPTSVHLPSFENLVSWWFTPLKLSSHSEIATVKKKSKIKKSKTGSKK